ncbi:serine hydrolase domain-containing protein [Amycolatopsis sp. NPDC059027]|uniref:serine hydrolase domain-containing protein n=1 Tax=Amycolatopsis sp. NPDC059027 TaxID=3346709 RepID=UPI00366EE285
MTGLRDVLEKHVGGAGAPGVVALIARGDETEVVALGSHDVEATTAMARDSIFRVASITKPIVAAAVMTLIEDGRVALDDPIGKWLPELAAPSVVRTPDSPVDDVVPAARPITVADLLDFRAGWGFPADFSLPAVRLLFEEVQADPRNPASFPSPDEWLAKLARVPLLHQPGEAWLYNTCSDLQGILIARVSGRSLPEYLAERVFEPLGMTDTGFVVPPEKRARFTRLYAPGDDGPVPASAPDDAWHTLPRFPSGGGGLVSTVDDWAVFGRMLLGGGILDGHRVLSAESVRRMTTDHLTPAQREASTLFLEGQGWGHGGSVDVAAVDPWNVPGRYGWVGGTGTTAHVIPATGTVAVLLTQLAMTNPAPTPLMREFWRYAATA